MENVEALRAIRTLARAASERDDIDLVHRLLRSCRTEGSKRPIEPLRAVGTPASFGYYFLLGLVFQSPLMVSSGRCFRMVTPY